MKRLLSKHPICAFCIISLLFTILLGFTNMVLMPSSTEYMFLLPQFAPMLAAMSVVMALHGKSSLYGLIRKASLIAQSWKYLFISLIIPAFLCSLSYVIFCLVEYKQLEFPEINRSFKNYALCLLFTIFGSFGEEIGWRGFMLQQFHKKYSFFASSLMVGLFWGFWHMKFHSGILVFAIYTLLAIEFSFIISWLYKKTKGTIISAIVFHSTINICSLVFFEKIISNAANQTMQITLYGIYTIVFLFPCAFIIKQLCLNSHPVLKGK